MKTTVKSSNLGDNLRAFLDVVDKIYADDPCYVRPLDLDVRQRLSPRHPYFQHSKAAIFTAHKNGSCVGRVVAHRNDMHLARYHDDVGFFGFLDTIDDQEVCDELIRSVASWHRSNGIRRLRGPITMNMAEEVGCLVEGFESPPMILMGHHRRYQASLLEAAGLKKVKDTYAWRYECGDLNPRVRKARDSIASLPEVRSRRVDMKNLERDVAQMLDIYNDAWRDSWGYVPLSAAEAQRAASEFRLIANPELSRIVDIEGVPSAFAYALPNINEAITDLNGKLFPFGAAKALWRVKVRGVETARLIGLGIRSALRHNRKYAALSAFLYAELNESGKHERIKWGELSYTLEDNAPMNVAIKMVGGRIYKKYRVFEMEL